MSPGVILSEVEGSTRCINKIGLNKPITHINLLDPNAVAVCPSGFDCVRYAHSAQDDRQTFIFYIRYNISKRAITSRPYNTTIPFGRITKQAMPTLPQSLDSLRLRS